MIGPDDVLEFWFGTGQETARVDRDKRDLWWGRNDATDTRIRARFGSLLPSLAEGALDHWTATARGRLALVIVADQFPRSIHRHTREAYAYDDIALQLCLGGLERDSELELRPVERQFLYLPLQHAEFPKIQDESVARFRALWEDAPSGEKKIFLRALDFAIRHRDIVARFGRFPHRNEILDRTSTPEELAFLRAPGSAF